MTTIGRQLACHRVIVLQCYAPWLAVARRTTGRATKSACVNPFLAFKMLWELILATTAQSDLRMWPAKVVVGATVSVFF